MAKHRFKESILSFFGHHVDPNKHEQLKGYKSEMDSKFQKVLESTEHDETDSSKTGILIELIKEFQEQYNELYKHYDHLTEELKAKAHGREKNDSSSSSSDSESDKDSPSKTKDPRNGKSEHKYQKLINDIQQERDAANLEVSALKERLTDVVAENEVLQLEYKTIFSKFQESEAIVHDLRTQSEVLDREKSEFLQQIRELNLKLETSTQLEAELNQKLEVVSKEKTDLIVERENTIKKIEEEERTIEELTAITSKIKDEKETLQREFDASRKELFEVNVLLQTSKQEVLSLAETRKATEEQNSFLSSKLLELSNEIKVAQDKIEEIVTESNLLREKIKENEKELVVHKEMHETYQTTTTSQTRSLEFQLDSLHTEKQEITKQRDDTVSELLKKLEDMEKDSLSKTETLTAQLKDVQVEIDSLNTNKSKLEEQLQNERDGSSEKTQQINTKQQELENQQNQILELQSELGVKVQQITEHGAQIESLKEELTTKSSDQQRTLKENEDFLVQIKNFQSEVDSLQGQKIQLEEQFAVKCNETNQLQAEKGTLEDKILELSSLQKKLENELVEASTQILTLTEKANSFERQIDNLSTKKVELDSDVEKKAQEIAEHILLIENLRQELQDKRETEKQKDDEISTLKQKLQDTEKDWLSRIDLLTADVNNRQVELESLQKQKTELQLEVDSLQGQKIQLEEQIEGKCNEIKQIQVEKETMLQEISSLQKKTKNEEAQNLTLTEKVNTLVNELENLSAQKAESDLEVDKKVKEIAGYLLLLESLRNELSVKSEMENQKAEEISALSKKLEDTEKDALSRVELLITEVNRRQEEVESLQNQTTGLRSELEVKVQQIAEHKDELSRNNVHQENLLKEKDEFMVRIKERDLEVDSLRNHRTQVEGELEGKSNEMKQIETEKGRLEDRISELEQLLVERTNEVSSNQEIFEVKLAEASVKISTLEQKLGSLQNEFDALSSQKSESVLQIENLKNELQGKTLDEERSLGEARNLAERVKDLELEAESLTNRNHHLEEEIKNRRDDIDRLREEIEREKEHLMTRISESESTISERGMEFFSLQKKHEERSEQITALTDQVNDLRLVLDVVKVEKGKLELQIEKGKEEAMEMSRRAEEQAAELLNKIVDLERSLTEKDERLGIEIFSKETRVEELEEIIEDLKRDMEQKGEELSNIEVKHRLLTQKHKVTDQLLVEKEESHRARVGKILEEHQLVEEKKNELSARVYEYKKAQEKIVREITGGAKGMSTELDRFSTKFEEDYGHLESCIYEIQNEVRIAKRWVKESRRQKEQLTEERRRLVRKVQEREEEVEELEKKLRRCEEEKSGLRVRMEELRKEKDEGMFGVGEEKKEAIRQLCISIEYHRSRCDYLKEMISKMSARGRGRGRGTTSIAAAS